MAATCVHACLPAEMQPLVTPGTRAGEKYVCKEEVKLLCSAASLIAFAVPEPAVKEGFKGRAAGQEQRETADMPGREGNAIPATGKHQGLGVLPL